jgi:hypothetical protein
MNYRPLRQALKNDVCRKDGHRKRGRFMMKMRILGIILAMAVAGCAGESKQVQLSNTAAGPTEAAKENKTIEFPKGTLFGGASGEQASALAQIFVESHNRAMEQFSKIEGKQESAAQNQQATQQAIQQGQKAILDNQETMKKSLDESNQKTLSLAEKNLETAQKTLLRLELLSKNQGTGEITLFYPIGQGKLAENSLEYKRLVNFVDFLARESKGRKVLLVSIGSASAIGKKSFNLKLAQVRAEFPQTIIDKYLINISHDYYKVYGIGDLYSPRKASRREQERYQHTRLIAVFETDQIPALPGEPAKK